MGRGWNSFGDISFYRVSYRRNWLEPISDEITLNFDGNLAYADGYNGDILPYYKYYYVGGVNSVRGYRSSSIGPKDSDGFSIGGNYKWFFSTELLMPIPNSNTKEMRLALFLDKVTSVMNLNSMKKQGLPLVYQLIGILL